MQLPNKQMNFDSRKIEEILCRENKFIGDLFSVLCMPNRTDQDDTGEVTQNERHRMQSTQMTTNRAMSLHELQERLKAVTSKKKLTYKEKLEKKGIKNRMRKKTKQDERNAQQKLLRAQKASNRENNKESEDAVKTEAEPGLSNPGKMVFSKFDFSNLGKKKNKKQEKDPKILLENLQKQKEKIDTLTQSGDLDKAIEIKQKAAWKNALAKAEGKKVKDDPILLKKSLERKEQKQRASKKKWEMRQVNVTKAKEERQKKRTENIQKRKKDKKTNKLKKAAKKGRIIPGF